MADLPGPDTRAPIPRPASAAPAFPRPASPGLRIERLGLRFGRHTVFDNLSFTVAPGSFVVLLGTSGVGKTSLLKVIAGLIAPAAGGVLATDGGPLAGRIAFMGQQDLLYPWLDAAENVMLGARLRRERRDRALALHLLERVGLASRARALPGQLSTGMRQRVALARTLYEARPVVLMDEPFSALDSFTRGHVQDIAAELLRGRTTLLITHDPLEASRLGHHLLVLTGQPARLGAPISVSDRPPPRPADDPEVLLTQARLLRALAGEQEG